jgi:hypothetical protein
MKKILAASFALAAVMGCQSNSDKLCIEIQTCLEADDPAAECSEEPDEDGQCAKDNCSAEAEANAACLLENGKCEDKIYAPDPLDACETEGEAFLDCFADKCA